jgi:hypothetical protein
LPQHEADALVELARTIEREMRTVDRQDHRELDEYHALRRKTNSQLELDALIKQYALALSFFDRWKQRGVESVSAMEAALAEIAESEPEPRRRSQLQLDYLREQIEMRVIGLGFSEFKPAWSSSKDAEVGTVSDLTELLHEILLEERTRDACRELPEAAVVPVMRRKTFKQLGTPTVQATQLAASIKELSSDELLEHATKERARLEAAGELDSVGDQQPQKPPPCDDSLVGTQLEICWRYWVTDPVKKTKGGKPCKQAVKIWCECEVVAIANGTTDRETARCKKLLKAGAVRVRWPADEERGEAESFSWHVLQDADWRKDAHMGWRYGPAHLEKLEAVAEGHGKRTKR